MKGSTMMQQRAAVSAVTNVAGWDAFRICHDTFQFYRCGDAQMFTEQIGLVHISGIERTDLPPDELTEPDRGLVFGNDRVGNVAQLQSLLAAGYRGFVSIEPFNPVVQQDPRTCVATGQMHQLRAGGNKGGTRGGAGLAVSGIVRRDNCDNYSEILTPGRNRAGSTRLRGSCASCFRGSDDSAV